MLLLDIIVRVYLLVGAVLGVKLLNYELKKGENNNDWLFDNVYYNQFNQCNNSISMAGSGLPLL